STPTFSLANGIYVNSQTVSISSSAGATIRYTTDGTTPTPLTGIVYDNNHPVVISAYTTVRAIAYATHLSPSAVGTAVYKIIPNPSGWQSPWGYRKPLVIDYTQVSGSSSLANFPVLFSVTDPNFRTVANGGKVGKVDGSDILFTAVDGVTK